MGKPLIFPIYLFSFRSQNSDFDMLILKYQAKAFNKEMLRRRNIKGNDAVEVEQLLGLFCDIVVLLLFL